MVVNLFKRHRFPPQIILLAVRWYCRYPVSYRDVQDMLSERGIHVDRSTINRWVVKFGPEISRRLKPLQSARSMYWHVDETYIRVAGKWRYLWRIVDEHGRFVEFRLTAKRDARAAKAFLEQASRNCGLYPPMTIVTDKAPTYPGIINAMQPHAYTDLPIKHINDKACNNRIESDHASLKRIINPGKGFQSLRTAKATLTGIEAYRSIKHCHVTEPLLNARAEIQFVEGLFQLNT